MAISLFVDFLVLVTISFFLLDKRSHPVLYLYVLLSMVFFYVSYVSIVADNLKLWEVDERLASLVIYKLAEFILFPMVAVWFMELLFLRKSKTYRCILTVLFLALPAGLERWMIHLDIITYKQWDSLRTILVWSLFYTLILLIRWVVVRQLIKEGVIEDAAVA